MSTFDEYDSVWYVFVCVFEWMTTEQEFTNMEKEKNNIFDQVNAEEVDSGLEKKLLWIFK